MTHPTLPASVTTHHLHELLAILQVQGEVGGKLCEPHGMTTTGQGHLIIADGWNRRLLVLDSSSGELINTQDLQECDAVYRPYLINNDKELLLWYGYQGKERVAQYSIK